MDVSRSRLLWTAVIVVVIAVVVAAVAVTGADDEPTSSPRPPATSTPSSPLVPRTLADLPQGPGTPLAYAVGRTVHMGMHQVTLDATPSTLLQSFTSAIVRYADGRIVVIRMRSGRVHLLAEDSVGPPLLDASGNYLAWRAPGAGRAEVVLASPYDAKELDRQSFPATPASANPLRLRGQSQHYELYVSSPADRKTWVWDVSEGQEGIAYDVPDSDTSFWEVQGLRGGRIHQVTASEVVIKHAPTVFAVGTVYERTFIEAERFRARWADFSWQVILYTRRDNVVRVRDRTAWLPYPGIGEIVRRTKPVRDTALRLPPLTKVAAVGWDSGKRVLLEVADASMPHGALVRCHVRSGACELVMAFRGPHLLAQ